MDKKCFKCGRKKPLSLFYKHPRMADGLLGKCKACTKKDVCENYVKTRPARTAYERQRCQDPERKKKMLEYQRVFRNRFPGKCKARRKLAYAVRTGKLLKQPCEVCGSTKVQAHHDDYRKPLSVRWFCFKHHREVAHGQVVTSDHL